MNPKLLRSRRKALGYTQARLAEAAGVDVRTIGRAEAGHPVAAETLVSLCSVLGLEAEVALGVPPEDDACGALTVVRSGKHQDQTSLLPEIEAALRGVPDVHTVVLPDCSVRHPAWKPIPFAGHASLVTMAFTAFVSVPGGGAFVILLLQLGVLANPRDAVGTAVHFVASLAFMWGALLMFWHMDVRSEAHWYRLSLKHRQASRLAETSGRAYAFGNGKLHLIRVSADAIDVKEMRIDARRAVGRSVEDDTVTYSVPTHDGRVSVSRVPADPRIDAILMRDQEAWGVRTMPRPSAAGLAPA